MAGRLTSSQKAAILADLGAGLPIVLVARKHGRSKRSVWTIRQLLKKSTVAPELMATGNDWRHEIKSLAVTAVKAGLICEEDQYKRAAIGVQALKGIGVFAPDSMSVNQMLSQCPADWRERYGIGDGAEPKVAGLLVSTEEDSS